MSTTPFELVDRRMNDGSRLFLELPQSLYPDGFVEYLKRLPGVEVTAFVDSIPESWIDFSFESQIFSVNNQFGEFWFFVKDPDCPVSILAKVRDHSVGMIG